MMLLRKSSPNTDLAAARFSRHLHLALLLLTAVAVSSPGCYNPSITDGGFLCAEAGKRCPDGFECLSDLHCHAVVQCSVAAITPLCQDAPKPGTACNPACQTGCACGRCNVSGPTAVCSTQVGSATLGQICNPSKDNCAAGLICLLEADTCGANLGRCYQHCTPTGATAAQCGSGRTCEIPILDGTNKDTGYKACSLMTQTCNPITTTAASNMCPSPALGCYLTAGGATFCDCPNRATPGILGALCDVYNDCGPGLICTASTGSVGNHCRQICMVQGQNTCAGGGRCNPVGTVYGYCN